MKTMCGGFFLFVFPFTELQLETVSKAFHITGALTYCDA